MKNYFPKTFASCYSTDELIGQFWVGEDDTQAPAEWSRFNVRGFCVAFHSKLNHLKIDVPGSDDELHFVGYVFDLGASFPNVKSRPSDENGFFENVESYLRKVAGRYICIAKSGEKSRIYLDVSGSLSLVYSPTQRMCASTIMSIPYTSLTEDNVELCEKLDVAHNNITFAFGLTPRKNIYRLPPNHYLDLESWCGIRHWPKQDIKVSDTPKEDIERIAEILKSTVSAACQRGEKIYLSLTAGFDSRALLGCSKENLNSINFFTWHLPDEIAENDVEIARKLAEIGELEHEEFLFTEAREDDRNLWLYRTGLAVGEIRGLSLSTTVNSMVSNSLYLPGLVSEFGRGAFWRADDSESTEITPNDLLLRMKLPNNPLLLDAANRWHESLPVDGVFQILDLLHLEQQLGCWAGVTAYGHAAGPMRFHPYSNGEILELMISLPVEYKKGNKVPLGIIRYTWPELLNLPINKMNVIDSPDMGKQLEKKYWRLLKKTVRAAVKKIIRP